MGLLDRIKKAFAAPPPAPTEDTAEERLLKQLEASSGIEAYIQRLRLEWFGEEKVQRPLVKPIIRAAKSRFPQHEVLIRILERIYEIEKLESADTPLFDYATSLTHTPNLAFEGHLYRASTLFTTSGRQAIASVLRGVTSERTELDLLRWYLHRLLKQCVFALYGKAGKDLGSDDAASALLLAVATANGSARLFSAGWTDRIKKLAPDCGMHVSTEVGWTRAVRRELMELAQEHSLKTSLNPAFIFRCRALAGLPDGGDFLSELREAVVRGRTRDTTDASFYQVETDAHRDHLKDLEQRLNRIATEYDGCLGLIEMDAERAAMSGSARSAPAATASVAAEKFKELLRRKPDQTYYAYRVAQILDDNGMVDEARPFWIHAARTPGSSWRSKLASLLALPKAFEFEAEKLRHAPDGAVPQAAESIGAYFETRMNEAWECSFWTAGYAFGTKAAQLYHLASARYRDSIRHEAARRKAVELYTVVDDAQGLRSVDGPSPDGVYEPVEIPLTSSPV